MGTGRTDAARAVGLALALAAAPVCAAPVAPAPEPAAVVSPETYRIRVEDVLEVFFWQPEEIQREVIVQPDGRVILPLVREISVAGLTRDEVAAAVQEKLGAFVKNPQVSVVVKRYGFARIMLLGQAAKPGPHDYRVGLTLMGLLGDAGGFGEDAVLTNIRVVRRTGEPGRVRTMKVNAKKILYKGAPDVLLEPGDVIYIPKTALAGFNRAMQTFLTPATLLIAVLAAAAALTPR